MCSSLSLSNLRRKPENSTRKQKQNRFDGLSEFEVQQFSLPDYLKPNLNVVFVGINPSLISAHRKKYYAGQGNHFYKLLHYSGFTPSIFSSEDDYKLLNHGIGLTNIVSRPTRSSSELKSSEIRSGVEIIKEKIEFYRPKIAVFNGKCIYQVFDNSSDEFKFGLQSKSIGETKIWVTPSSSARCANFPRMIDKLHFFKALNKYLKCLDGEIHVDLDEFRFEGKCKQFVASTSKMWRRKEVSKFLNGGRIANRQTIREESLDEDVATVSSTEFVVHRMESLDNAENIGKCFGNDGNIGQSLDDTKKLDKNCTSLDNCGNIEKSLDEAEKLDINWTSLDNDGTIGKSLDNDGTIGKSLDNDGNIGKSLVNDGNIEKSLDEAEKLDKNWTSLDNYGNIGESLEKAEKLDKNWTSFDKDEDIGISLTSGGNIGKSLDNPGNIGKSSDNCGKVGKSLNNDGKLQSFESLDKCKNVEDLGNYENIGISLNNGGNIGKSLDNDESAGKNLGNNENSHSFEALDKRKNTKICNEHVNIGKNLDKDANLHSLKSLDKRKNAKICNNHVNIRKSLDNDENIGKNSDEAEKLDNLQNFQSLNKPKVAKTLDNYGKIGKFKAASGRGKNLESEFIDLIKRKLLKMEENAEISCGVKLRKMSEKSD